MATYTKIDLSYSTDGLGIPVVEVTDPGTYLHAMDTDDSADYDEVWLYACNTDSTDRKLTLEFGGTTAPDDLVEVTIGAEAGWVLVCPGILLQNSLVVKFNLT